MFNWDSTAGASSNWSFSMQYGGVVFNDLSIVESAAPGDDTIYAGGGNDFVYGRVRDNEIFDEEKIEKPVLQKQRQQMEVVLCG